jgi:hypothetical protein
MHEVKHWRPGAFRPVTRASDGAETRVVSARQRYTTRGRHRVEWASQLITLGAVLSGGAAGYVTNHLSEKSRFKQSLLTRWDQPKLEAYVDYIAQVRGCIYAAVLLYEVQSGIRIIDQSVESLTMNLVSAEGKRALAFERVMLLAGESVIEAAHVVNRAEIAIDWQARGLKSGTLEEWRTLHSTVFTAINRFHEEARRDLGVRGRFTVQAHAGLGLNLPQ